MSKKIVKGSSHSHVTRRDILKYSAYGLATLVVSSGLTACGGSSSATDDDIIDVQFTHGVASGDPLSDRVILWTRVAPVDINALGSIDVEFEVSMDGNFEILTHSGRANVSAEGDYILKVDAVNLDPETNYFYRFTSNGIVSVVGKTKTLPAADATVDDVKLAVFSCSNYPAGFFNVYAEAAKLDDLDAVIHLGDYIYEYRMGEYATENAEAIGRTLAPDNDVELIELVDYRKRYALYRSDSNLQQLHQQVPFIVVPDDHEVANDAYIDGAENHDPETEGEFSERKRNALQAYFEWLPIRPAAVDDNVTLYRRFQWGSLVNLMMLDTRLIGRSQQLPALSDPSYYNADGSFNASALIAALTDTSRTLLGADQLAWLLNELSASRSTWQVLGQQVLMGRMNIPLEVLVSLGGDISQLLTGLATIKARLLAGDPTVTPEEQARVETAAPYNLDAWDGYQYEREVILGTAAAAQQNLVVLAGDTHNAWSNNLKTSNGDNVGVEFAVAGVTSPGLEDFLDLDNTAAQGLEQGLGLLIDDLQYANYFERGFMVVHFTEDKVDTDWIYVDTVLSPEYTVLEERSASLSVVKDTNVLSTTV